MLEEEAKKKWCPHRSLTQDMTIMNFMIAAGVQKSSIGLESGLEDLDGKDMCIGSACMMWRENVPTVVGYEDSGAPSVVSKEDGGYCGLAGKG